MDAPFCRILTAVQGCIDDRGEIFNFSLVLKLIFQTSEIKRMTLDKHFGIGFNGVIIDLQHHFKTLSQIYVIVVDLRRH